MIRRRAVRAGFSLLEVMLAMAIFLLAIAGLAQLMNIATEQAREIHYLNTASQLLQSKMNEVIAGVVPLTGQSESGIDGYDNWQWSMDCETDATPDLWHVTVTVSYRDPGTQSSESWTLSQLVLDPAARGAIEAGP